jgi:hypothetical protein
MATSKRFGYYRHRLGIDDTPDGHRHSRINFHSLRRGFVTKNAFQNLPCSALKQMSEHAIEVNA